MTDKVGRVEMEGLDRLVAGQQPVPVAGVGDLYAAGELATMVATTAQDEREKGGGLEAALHEFGLSREQAAHHFAALGNAGWLLFVRAEDAKARRDCSKCCASAPARWRR